jgi:hypothetical protein
MSAVLLLEAAANATRTTTTAIAAAAAPAQVASAAPSAANSTAAAGIVPWIQGFASAFAANANVVTLSLDNATIDIGKAAVVFLVITGVLLWFSRANRRLGRDLVQGGIFIGIFIEFVVPFLMSIHY